MAIHIGFTSDKRLIWLALTCLEEAAAEAEVRPVLRHHGHRVALAVVAAAKLGLDWHYSRFWQMMAEGEGHDDHHHHYARTTALNGFLDYWHREAGIERRNLITRAAMTQAYGERIIGPQPKHK